MLTLFLLRPFIDFVGFCQQPDKRPEQSQENTDANGTGPEKD